MLLCRLFLLFALWVSASLAGAGGGISTTLAVLTLSSFAASAIFLANSFTRVEQEEHLGHLWSSLIEKYGHYMDLVRGLLVVACLPLFCVYLIFFSCELVIYIRSLILDRRLLL